LNKARVSGADGRGRCRELAAEILAKVEKRNAYADILLDKSLKGPSLTVRDRALLTQLVYGALRWKGRVDWLLGRSLRRPLAGMNPYLRNILRLTLYQILFLDKVPDYAAVNEGVELGKKYGGKKAGGLVNAVVRKVLKEKGEGYYPDPQEDLVSYLSVFWSHPDWLVKRWLGYFGREETEALLKADNDESPLVLRVNRLKGEREVLIQSLRGMGFDAEPTVWSPQGIQLRSASAVTQLPGFEEGLFQVQGEASQLVGYLLDPRPGERVLDACAAPGGKTTHLAELMQDKGEIVATDVSTRGLEKLKQNVQRLGLTSVRHFCVDVGQGLTGPLASPYDRILVDAPCSGLGTLRSHPEAKWQKSERDMERLIKLQKKILGQVCSRLKPGGVLVYATCTLTREENEGAVEDFLSRHQNFVLEGVGEDLPRAARDLACGRYLLTLPHKHGTDGFFAARMRKVAQGI
jgi:16S rRNA (cytosine967-C5)-methyltransferase